MNIRWKFGWPSTFSAAFLVSVLALPTLSWSQDREIRPAAVQGTFPVNLQTAFKAVVDNEFSFATEKAGISVAVYSGSGLWVYATGIADSGIEMTVDTPIPVSSTSKTFMSALVLSQIDEGLYKLTDSLEVVLSGHPAYETFNLEKINPQVSIEQLLSMRSGLPNYHHAREGKRKFFVKTTPWKPSDNVNLVNDLVDAPRYLEPGEFDYNDTNLALLGLIAAFQGGKSLDALYKQKFFRPLGLEIFFPPHDAVPSNMARPFGDRSPWQTGFGSVIEAAPFTFDHFWVGQARVRYPCCGLITTSKNMARWAYELYSSEGNAVPETARASLLGSFVNEPVQFAGMKRHYGYFITKQEIGVLNPITVTIGHPGGGSGYVSLLQYSPKLDVSVSILMNFLWRKSPGKCDVNRQRISMKRCIASGIFAAYADALR